jgi:hypothetical protein
MFCLMLLASAQALRCSINVTSNVHCDLTAVSCQPQSTRSPCTTEPSGDFTRADFDGSLATCRQINMSLVTPVDFPTLIAIANLCSTSFIGAKRRLEAGDCRYHDVDSNNTLPDLMDANYWYFSEPSTPLVSMCNSSSYHERCAALFCENATLLPQPQLCENRLHDRECGSYVQRPWAGAHCVVCGRRAASVTTIVDLTLSFLSTVNDTSVGNHTVSFQVVPDDTVVSGPSSTANTIVIIVGVLGAVVAIAILTCIAFVLRLRSRSRSNCAPTSDAADMAATPDSIVPSNQYAAWQAPDIDSNYEKGDLFQ